MKVRFILVFTTLILASLACNFTPLRGGGEAENVLFQDDFSDPSSGWARISETAGETNYANGVYRIYVNTANLDVWARPGLNFYDVRIEVDATKVGGPDDNDFGIICRYQNNQNFYEFVISSDGYYSILKLKDGQQVPIGMDAMQPNERIQKGAATNHLRADCIGSTFTLYVNGEKLGEVQDSEYAAGDVGLIAGSYQAPGTDIHFDNFTVMKP